MSFQRRVFVVGGHITPFIGKKHPDFIWKRHPDFGKRENPSLEDYIVRSVTGALEATGVAAAEVEKAWIGNFAGELFSSQGHLGAAVAGAHPDLAGKPIMRLEAACASGGLAYASAVESIQAGTDVALVVGAEVQTTVSAREGGDYLARASHYRRQRGIDDFTFPAMFARRAKYYRKEYGLTEDELAHVAVKAYANANRNPLAHMKAVEMTHEMAAASDDHNPNFLSNEELKPFLKMSDCSQVSDGAAAMILASEAGLAKLGKTIEGTVEVLGIGVSTDNLFEDGDPLVLNNTKRAVQAAFAQSNATIKDVNVAEVHDCFTITELLMYEALGLANQGRGIELIKEGRTRTDGEVPVNTGGGLVGFGHPVGATGVKQVLEIYRQMKGQCGDYQVSNTPELGLTANMGGDDKTAVSSVLANR